MRNTLYLMILINGLLSISVNAKIDYEITITQPQHHFAQISIILPAGQNQLELMLPNWRTGNYQIINQANGVRQFSAKDSTGKQLEWTRLNKSHWRITNPTELPVMVSYSIYANELGKRTRHIDSTHAYLDATAVLMYEASRLDENLQVKLNVPENWKSYSGMVETSRNQFIAQSYHQLASSPIEVGISELHEFSVEQRDYQLVIWGKGNFDGDKMANDLEALAAASQKIWKGYPYHKYVFIVHATSGESGATEHINSTVIQRPRFSFAPRKEYLKFLNTASHELIHTWNVKAYRPAGLVPYDYQQENYSDLLWVAEGTTSYFQGYLLLAAKLQTIKEFLADLSERIDDYQKSPGHLEQSIAESSFEKWIAQNGDFANNNSVNIYSEGFMASWSLDYNMLIDSNLTTSYKKLHQTLFSQIDSNSENFKRYFAQPYDANTIKSIAKDLTTKDYSQWWKQQVDTPLQIDFDLLLDGAGLKFSVSKDKDFIVNAGFTSELIDGDLILTKVEKNGPAWNSGLTVGDQLVSINRLKVDQENMANRLEKYKPGETVDITIFRNEQLQTHSLEFSKTTKKPRKIQPQESPTEKQKAFFKAWLGVELPESIADTNQESEER